MGPHLFLFLPCGSWSWLNGLNWSCIHHDLLHCHWPKEHDQSTTDWTSKINLLSTATPLCTVPLWSHDSGAPAHPSLSADKMWQRRRERLRQAHMCQEGVQTAQEAEVCRPLPWCRILVENCVTRNEKYLSYRPSPCTQIYFLMIFLNFLGPCFPQGIFSPSFQQKECSRSWGSVPF